MLKNGLIIDANGDKRWYLEGKLHRTGGPAVEYASGDKEYYLDGKRHRTDGPAIEYTNGSKFWYYHGEEIMVSSNEEFLRMLRLKAFW